MHRALVICGGLVAQPAHGAVAARYELDVPAARPAGGKPTDHAGDMGGHAGVRAGRGDALPADLDYRTAIEMAVGRRDADAGLDHLGGPDPLPRRPGF